MNENDSELTTICSQLKMQFEGDKLSPSPFGFEFDTLGGRQLMHLQKAFDGELK